MGWGNAETRRYGGVRIACRHRIQHVGWYGANGEAVAWGNSSARSYGTTSPVSPVVIGRREAYNGMASSSLGTLTAGTTAKYAKAAECWEVTTQQMLNIP